MATKTTAKKPAAKKKPTTKKTVANAKKSVSASAKTVAAAKTPVKKSASAKAKKPASASESVVSKATTKNKRPELTPMDRLRGMHISNVLTGIILIILTLVFVKVAKIGILMSYQAKDTFTVTDHVTLGNATEVLGYVDLRWLLVVILGLTTIISLMIGSKLFRRYEATVKAGISGYRWLFYGFIGAILVSTVTLMAGVQDIATLVTVGLLAFAGSIFGWVAERENAGNKTPHKFGFWASTLTMVLAHLPMLASLVTVTLIGAERFSWYAYAAVAVSVLTWVANTINLRSSINKKARYEHVTFEQRYIRIDQISKFLIVLIVFAAFSK